MAAKTIARPFAAYAAGDCQTCGTHLADGLAASGDVFAALAQLITAPG